MTGELDAEEMARRLAGLRETLIDASIRDQTGSVYTLTLFFPNLAAKEACLDAIRSIRQSPAPIASHLINDNPDSHLAARVRAEPDEAMVGMVAGVLYRRNPVHIEDRLVTWERARKLLPHVYAGILNDARAVAAAYRAAVTQEE